MPFPIHPHMLRHACGFKLANDGHDTRALQHYLGHKNIQHTVRYTEMAPDRFKEFWTNWMAGAGSIAPARKILPSEEDDAPYRRDHSPTGGRTLRGMRSLGPTAVSASRISRLGLRLDGAGSSAASDDCPLGAGSAAAPP